jgi:hypothetical protein
VNSGETKVGFVRKTAAIVLAAAFVIGVAGCADVPQTISDCTPAATSGSASEAITAAGKFGQDPDAKVPTPTVTKRVQTSIIKKGSGPVLGQYDIARAQFTIYSGTTGALLGTSGQAGYTDATLYQSTVGQKTDPIGKNLMCQTVGTRAVSVLTAAQFFGSAAQATTNGVKASEALIVVTDIEKGYRGRATGILQPLGSGFPSVVTAPNGTPGLTFDLQTAPKKVRSEVVRKGNGATVKKGDTLLLQIEGVAWTNPPATTTFTSTWTTHAPKVTALSALDPGSAKSLVGTTVGSQVLVVVPSKFGYSSGKAPDGYPTGETLVFVYDVLGIE